MMSKDLDLVEPDKVVIKEIERLLEEAKKGAITGIAYAVSMPGGYSSSGWAGMNKANMNILGEMQVLQRDFMDILISLRVDPETGETN